MKCPIFVPDFNHIWTCRQIYESAISNFNEIRPMGAALMRADVQSLLETIRTRVKMPIRVSGVCCLVFFEN